MARKCMVQRTLDDFVLPAGFTDALSLASGKTAQNNVGEAIARQMIGSQVKDYLNRYLPSYLEVYPNFDYSRFATKEQLGMVMQGFPARKVFEETSCLSDSETMVTLESRLSALARQMVIYMDGYGRHTTGQLLSYLRERVTPESLINACRTHQVKDALYCIGINVREKQDKDWITHR